MALESKTILLVDDDDSVREVVAHMLEKCRDLIEAEDGQKAIELFTKYKDQIDCVLLDVMMPGLTGLQTFEEIRKIRSDVRVVFISGYSSEIPILKNAGNHRCSFLRKPFLTNDLLMEVETLCGTPYTAPKT